jgi:putative membrane protein
MRTVLNTIISIAILAWLIPGVSYTSWVTLIITGVVLAILQTLVKPILKLLFLPINVITFGLFSWVINVLILWLAVYLVPGFHINNLVVFGVAFNQFFSLLTISFLMSVIQSFVKIFV